MIPIEKYLDPHYAFSAADYMLLEKTLQETPWFSAAHQAFAKAALQLKKEDELSKLNQAALFAYNREFLFDYYLAEAKADSKEKTAAVKVPTVVKQKLEEKVISKQIPKEKVSEKEQQAISPAVQPKPVEQEKKETIEPPTAKKESSKPKSVDKAIPPAPLINKEGKKVESKEDLRDMVRQELERIDKERAAQKKDLQKEGKTLPKADLESGEKDSTAKKKQECHL
jgi:type IV secretory pathway VirB10-like protein